MFDDSIAPLLKTLEGIRNDFATGLLELEGELDRDDYVVTMIDKPLAEIEAARKGRGLAAEDLVILEDAGRALAADIRSGVVISASPEITSGDYVETVLGHLLVEEPSRKP